MDIEEVLFNERVDLSGLLEKLITDNSDLQMKWISKAYQINGKVEYRSYLTTDQVLANPQWCETFMKEFMPLYEQLTLYSEYYDVRAETLRKDSYNIEQLKELAEEDMILAQELLMMPSQRFEIIEALDFLELEKRNIPKGRLLYLAANTPATYDLYELMENKMRKNPSLFPLTSAETNKELANFFETIDTLIYQQIREPKEERISYYLTSLLLQFYPDFKDVIDGIKGRKMNLR